MIKLTVRVVDPVVHYREKWEAENPCTGDNACAGASDSRWAFYGGSQPCDNCMFVEFNMDRLYDALRHR
jgi:hypothetical protein